MSKIKEVILSGTTDTAGAATVDGTYAILGLLYAIEWVDGTLSDGGGGLITAQNTASGEAQTLCTLANAKINADAWYYPRTLLHGMDGAALTGTQGGDRTMPVINGVPRVVVGSGGSGKTFSCILYYYE